MKQLEKVAALLVSEDPKQKAEKILLHAIVESRARGGAVLSLAEGRLVPFVIRETDLDVLARLRRRWPSLERSLAKGSPWVEKGFAMAPIRDKGALLGVLFLGSPEAFDADELGVLLVLLAKAITAEREAPPDAAMSAPPTSAAEAEKIQLLSVLHQHDWNIARVSSVLGIARGTIYQRLERYGIPRRKVPKVLRRTVPA